MKGEVFVQFGSGTTNAPLFAGWLEVLPERRVQVHRIKSDKAPEVGSLVDVHWMEDGHTARRAARVEEVSVDEAEELSLVLFPTGEIVQAGSREAYRVRVSELQAQVFLDGRACRLLDVGATGLGIVSEGDHAIDEQLEVRVVWEDLVASGEVRVRARRELLKDEVRYGVEALGKDGELLQQLRTLSAEMQIRLLSMRAVSRT